MFGMGPAFFRALAAAVTAGPSYLMSLGQTGSYLAVNHLGASGSNLAISVTRFNFSAGSGLATIVLVSADGDSVSQIAVGGAFGPNKLMTPLAATISPAGDLTMLGDASGELGRIALVLKYNAAGAQQWVVSLVSADVEIGLYRVDVDGNGNVYCCTEPFENADFEAESPLIKLSSTGALVWRKKWAEAIDSLAVSQDGAYVYTASSISGANVALACLRADGTPMWNRVVQTTPFDPAATRSYFDVLRVATYSDGSIYMLCAQDVSAKIASPPTAARKGLILLKLNSSGDFVRGVTISDSSLTIIDGALACDESGVYVTGKVTNASRDSSYILAARVTHAGVLVWQRSLSSASSTLSVQQGATVSNDGNFGITFSVAAETARFFLVKLPIDGSKTGALTLGADAFLYGESALSVSTGAVNIGAPVSFTVDDSSITAGTFTVTDSVDTFATSKALL